MNSDFVYKGIKASLLTKHCKERVIKPVFEKATGCEIIVESQFDTDLFGTFTREIPRQGTQLEAARMKAQKGMELLGTALGLASEGSFGAHPATPFLPWNREIVFLTDRINKIEIFGEYAGCETNFSSMEVKSLTEAEAFARKAGFPEHFLVINTKDEEKKWIKGIQTWEKLKEIVPWSLKKSKYGSITLETDMRANANPTRMLNILKATENLIQKINQKCPRCETIGFAVADFKSGLPCESCGLPTGEIMAEIYKCQKCSYTMEVLVGKDKADPGRCPFCNP